MEQKDIDRILICRAAVDKQREFNKVRVEAYSICKSVTEAKELIESKIGATTISIDSSVKSTDGIKKALEVEREKYTIAIYETLSVQGFGDFQSFRDFNERSNFEVFKECYPIIGSCDWCGDIRLEERECIKILGENCWIGDRPQKATDMIFLASYDRMLKNETELIKKTVCSLSYCPKGHGFYNDIDNFKTPPFDVFWRA